MRSRHHDELGQGNLKSMWLVIGTKLHIHIYIYIYIHIYIYVCVCDIYVYTYTSTSIHTHILSPKWAMSCWAAWSLLRGICPTQT